MGNSSTIIIKLMCTTHNTIVDFRNHDGKIYMLCKVHRSQYKRRAVYCMQYCVMRNLCFVKSIGLNIQVVEKPTINFQINTGL